MEKFFINLSDVIKYLEIKAQEKSQRKKYWVLGNQYLQPVDDVEEEKKCLDYDFKKKARCVYQAARTGMKEGMLTGFFMGGFYGVIKNLNENLGKALMPSSLNNAKCLGGGRNENGTEKNIKVSETNIRNTVQSSTNNIHQPQSDVGEQLYVRDNALKNKKRGKSTFTNSEQPDRSNSNNEVGVEKRPSSAGKNGSENFPEIPVENVRPNTVVRSKKSKSKLRDKIEVVGYAFIEELESKDSESLGGSGSDESARRKRDSQRDEGESESQDRSRVNSDPGGTSSSSTYPKHVLGSIEEIYKKKKLLKKEVNKNDRKKSSSESSHETYPVQILKETKSKLSFREKKNEKLPKERKQLEVKSQNDYKSSSHSTTTLIKPKTSDRKIGLSKKTSKIKKSREKESKGSRTGIEPSDHKLRKTESRHSNKSYKNKSRKFDKGNKARKPKTSRSKVLNAFYENIFIPNKISKSILVDADGISNGYSLSLNNDSMNSDEEFDPLHDSAYTLYGSTGTRFSRISGHSKVTIRDDDPVSLAQKKKLAFLEPEIISKAPDHTPMRHQYSTSSFKQILADNSQSDSIHSSASSSGSEHASQSSTTEVLNEYASVQSIQSVEKVFSVPEDTQPSLGQSVEPSSEPVVVEPIPVLSIGDTAATSYVQNEGSSNIQSKEFSRDQTGIVGTESTVNKVRSVKKSEHPCAPKSGFLLLKTVSDSLILLSACNCAVVLGILCAVVSSTKASLSF